MASAGKKRRRAWRAVDGTRRGKAKVAALGHKVSKSCSYHGLALNVATDLEAFRRIHPCGYEDLKTVDMQTLGIKDNIDMISQRLLEHLQKQLMSP